MRKTLGDLASYLKDIIVPGTQEAYAVDPAYTHVATEAKIREGVLAFRGFLYRLCDVLIAQGDAYDNTAKAAHAHENRTTLSTYYPFLHNVNTMLLRIGYDGVLAGDAQSLVCGNEIFHEKLSAAKTLEILRFLAACGVCINGIDINSKKQNLLTIQAITITYPDNPAMLTGLKVMAIAQTDHGTLANQDVLLRCDDRVLRKDGADVASIVRDTVRPLSADVQDFILRLHARYVGQGLTGVVEIKGFHIHIKHCDKRKEVWGINASLNNGYHINVKASNAQAYADTVETFPPFLRELIARGYGCGRKRGAGRCDGGCRGMSIPLDASVLAMRDDIVTWLDQELLCLKRK